MYRGKSVESNKEVKYLGVSDCLINVFLLKSAPLLFLGYEVRECKFHFIAIESSYLRTKLG